MNSGRMKKLAGINEGNTFKNGKFTLDRFDVSPTFHGDITDELSPDGEWCAADDVAELESVAREMFGIINSIMSGLEKADRNYTPFKLTQANIRDMKSLLKKVKSL